MANTGNMKRPSRLDLLDDNFTSFPLAHPLSSSPVPTKLIDVSRASRRRCDSDASSTCLGDDTMEQIVLVEDYIEEKNLKLKKKSVYDLKNEGALPELTTSVNSSSGTLPEEIHYEGLKYCVLCEKPLYELSSFIREKDFKELVCSGCILRYEEISRSLGTYEGEYNIDDTTTDTSFQTVRFKSSSDFLFDTLIQDLKKLQNQDHQRKLRSQKSIIFSMIPESICLKVMKFFKWT